MITNSPIGPMRFVSFLSVLLCVLFSGSAANAQVDVNWWSGTGSWGVPGNWVGGIVPDNHGSVPGNYRVLIDNNAGVQSIVTINSFNNYTIDALWLDELDELILEGSSSLRFEQDASRPLSGIIDNFGTIYLQSGAGVTNLLMDKAITLRGGGKIVLSGNGAYIADLTSSDGYLTIEDNTIEGKGFVGNQQLGLTIQALGRIHANVNGETLQVASRNNVDFINQGNLDASLGGILDLDGFSGGILNNSGGSIRAFDGSQVRLLSGLSITGGTLEGIGTGQILVPLFESVTIADASLLGNVHVKNGGTLRLNGTIQNQTLHLDGAAAGSAYIVINNQTTLTGNGTINMNGASAGILATTNTNGHLINTNNLIRGQGVLGNTLMRLTNQSAGLIDADVNGATLSVQTINGSDFVNEGTLRATNGGVLRLLGFSGGVLENTNGDIQAWDNSRVELANTIHIHGGFLSTTGSGEFVLPSFEWARLNDLVVTGPVRVQNNAILYLDNSIDFDAIELQGAASGASSIYVTGAGATLTGDGTITMSGAGARLISPAGAGNQGLLINENALIQGQGNIGGGRMALTNLSDGVIDANVSGQVLLVNTPNGSDLVNDGVMKASNGGILRFSAFGPGILNNTNGMIIAADNSKVDFVNNNLNIVGGTLAATGSGFFEIPEFTATIFKDLSAAAPVEVSNNAHLYLQGTIDTSTINLNGQSTGNSNLVVRVPVSLGGNGVIQMNGAGARIWAGNSLNHLTNVNNTIQGQGQIGTSGLRFTNQSDGVVDANVAGEQLRIVTQNDGTTSVTTLNDGTFRASNGGTLLLTGTNANRFGGNGTFEALDASSVIFDSAAYLDNIDGAGNLFAGTWRAIDGGSGAIISVDRVTTPLITNIGPASGVELSGTNSSFIVAGTAIDASLTGNQGSLTLRNGRVMNTTAGLSNNGDLTIDGGLTQLNVAGTLVQTAGLTLLIDGATLVSTFVDVDGGRFAGNGSVSGPADFDTASIMAPGASAGILQFNDDTVIAGILETELGGKLVDGMAQLVNEVNSTTDYSMIDFDQINILGAGSLLDGTTLDFSLINGFTLTTGDFFDVLTGDSLSVGNINLVAPTGFNASYSVLNLNDATFGGNRDVLRIGFSSAVPEPAATVVLVMLFSSVAIRRRRVC